VIIGWRAAARGIDLLYLPSRELPRAGKDYPELLERRRHVGSAETYEALLRAGCQSVRISLSFHPQENDPTIDAMDAIPRHYTVTHCRVRAVALFDMVSFSLYSAFERITQINVLAHHINLAASRVEHAGLPMDLSMSSTGDGFYIWNRNVGLPADLALYYVTCLAMAYNPLAMEDSAHDTIPLLRGCFDFGDHYEYHQASGSKPDPHGFIVGDVTIRLARLISVALPQQFLVGNSIRALGDDDGDARRLAAVSRIDAPSFLGFAKQNARILAASPIGDQAIARINTYLTGDNLADNEFTINKYEVTDKHGLLHRCFNAKFNVTDTEGRSIGVGLLTRQLEQFEVRQVEDEDIRLKVVWNR
jgi:hypothetical protein